MAKHRVVTPEMNRFNSDTPDHIYIHPDILVIGTGRSGTSFVSGVLHERLGVCMGHEFAVVHVQDSRRNYFELSYEDAQIWNWTIRLCGKFGDTSKTKKATIIDWLDQFTNVHLDCPNRCKKRLFGFKSPHLTYLTPEQLLQLAPKLIIRTYRNEKDTVVSMNKYRRENGDKWLNIYREIENNMYRLEAAVGRKIKFVWLEIPGKDDPRLEQRKLAAYLEPHINRLEPNAFADF